MNSRSPAINTSDSSRFKSRQRRSRPRSLALASPAGARPFEEHRCGGRGARLSCGTDRRPSSPPRRCFQTLNAIRALRLGSATYVVRTGAVTPKPPALRGAKKGPMVLALWPPVWAIPVRARERYDDVLARVPVCDGRCMTRLVRSRANQRRDRECTDEPPHDVPLSYSCPFVALAQCHNRHWPSAPDSGRRGL
jgi:hypothetical protein